MTSRRIRKARQDDRAAMLALMGANRHRPIGSGWPKRDLIEEWHRFATRWAATEKGERIRSYTGWPHNERETDARRHR